MYLQHTRTQRLSLIGRCVVLGAGQTLSDRDIEYHLSEGGALYLQDLTNGTRIRTRLGHSLQVRGIADLRNASILVREAPPTPPFYT